MNLWQIYVVKELKVINVTLVMILETVGILKRRTMPIIVKIQNTLANKSNAMVSFDYLLVGYSLALH